MNYKDKCLELINKDVIIIDINNTYIDKEVKIGKKTTIYPNTFIRGKTEIGENNIIDMGSIINNSVIKNNNTIINSYIDNSTIGNNNLIGPYANIHSDTIISDNVIIGNYVEVKNSKVESNSKAKHLSYLGDTKIGNEVNIGGGVIIANYNPLTEEKYETIIDNDVVVGSSSVLVAPIKIEENSLIGAGSTITDDVPKYSLAIARSKQINKKKL